jgi:hypothetical protein
MEIARPKKHTGLQKRRTKSKDPRQKIKDRGTPNLSNGVFDIPIYGNFSNSSNLSNFKLFKPFKHKTFQLFLVTLPLLIMNLYGLIIKCEGDI